MNWISLLLTGALLTVLFGMGTQAADAAGDVNTDGASDAEDVALLQNWLLGQEVTLPDGQAGDLNGDGMLNGMDLCLMKRGLLTNTGRQVTVSDAAELAQAMAQAQAGDVIRLNPGMYQVSDSGAQKFYGTVEGNQRQPIILQAADPADPPVLTGTGTDSGYVMHITGDYWVLEHLLLTNAQKGIVLDNSNHTVLRSCEIANTGAEAVAIRDGSSYCLVQQCSIHDTGLVTPGYGEGVYIGSAYSTSGFDYKCDYNRVDGCVFRNVAAEHVDVKEYTTGTEISGCTFHGEGMTGENYAGSFLDIAGNDCYVHDNTGYRTGTARSWLLLNCTSRSVAGGITPALQTILCTWTDPTGRWIPVGVCMWWMAGIATFPCSTTWWIMGKACLKQGGTATIRIRSHSSPRTACSRQKPGKPGLQPPVDKLQGTGWLSATAVYGIIGTSSKLKRSSEL